VEGWPRAIVGKSDAGSLNSLAGAISRRQSPARAAASVVQIWSIATDSWANLQAPWRTHKPLILLGFWCPVVPGRVPEGPLKRTLNLVLRDPGVRDSSGGGPEVLGEGTAGFAAAVTAASVDPAVLLAAVAEATPAEKLTLVDHAIQHQALAAEAASPKAG